MSKKAKPPVVERVQTGIRIEKRILKVLKGLAEFLDMSVGDLLEGIVLHAFEGKAPPFPKEVLGVIEDLRRVYRLDLDLSSRPLRVRVRDAAGEPVVGAEVEISAEGRYGNRRGAKTDDAGEVELTLVGDSEHSVHASADGYAESVVEIDPDEEGFDGEVEIELRGAVS